MKAMKLLWLASLALGLTLAWSTGVPARMAAGDAALVGGQVMVGCCQGQHTINCVEVASNCCDNHSLHYCLNLGIGPQRCWRYPDSIICAGGGACSDPRTELCLDEGVDPPATAPLE